MSTVIRPIALTLRIHRFVVLLAVIVVVAFTVAVAGAILHLQSLVPPAGCDVTSRDETCLEAIWAYRGAAWDIGILRGRVPTLAAAGLGLILGVPIVAGEVERGTTLLAWSLAARRRTWLLHRAVPLLVLLLLGVGLIAVAQTQLAAAVASALDEPPDQLGQLGSAGPTLVAYGLLGFGAAVLLGALIGRSLPALAVGGILLALVIVLGGPATRYLASGFLSETWREDYDPVARTWIEPAATLSSGDVRFEVAGELLHRRELAERKPAGVSRDEWYATEVTRVRTVVPARVYPVIEASQTMGMSLLGLCAFGAAFVVVSRRRPL